MVTGESVPVEKQPAAAVTGGTLNGTGSFIMRADRVGEATLLAQIVRMVAEAQRTRAPIQRLADRIAEYFVPAVVARRRRGVRGVEPLGSRAAIRAGAGQRRGRPDHRVSVCARPRNADGDHGRHRPRRKAGVLIRNAEALERLERVDTLVVDKTGTLTEGTPVGVANCFGAGV